MKMNLDNLGNFIIKDHPKFDYHRFILGSSSPRRIQLISEFIKDFEIIKPEIDEKKVINEYLEKNSYGDFLKDRFMVTSEIAHKKALAVFEKANDGLILSADTVVVTDDKILGKPKDDKDALNTLISLLGKFHYVCTGICILKSPEEYKLYYVVSQVKFVEKSELSLNFIKEYVKSKIPLDKAGSYNIQEVDKVLVDSFYGDYYNIVGLPLPELLRSIKI